MMTVQSPCLCWVAELMWCFAGNYKLLCTIHADLKQLGVPIEMIYYKRQKVYRVHLDLVVMFGLTEMQAQIAWKVGVSISS